MKLSDAFTLFLKLKCLLRGMMTKWSYTLAAIISTMHIKIDKNDAALAEAKSSNAVPAVGIYYPANVLISTSAGEIKCG